MQGNGTAPGLQSNIWLNISPQGFTGNVPACCNAVAEGVDVDQRIGNRIQMESLYIKGLCQWTIGEAGDYVVPRGVRFRVVLDKQTNGEVPNVVDIFAEPSTASITTYGGAVIDYAQTFMNEPSTSLRFRTLADFWVDPPLDGEIAAGQTSVVSQEWERFIPLKGLVTSFKTEAGAVPDVAEVTDHGIFLFACAQGTGTAIPQVYGIVRLRYVDV